MKTFDEIYQIVEESSHETAFNRGECEAVYNLLRDLPLDAAINIVEIGVEFGRSTSIFAEFQVAKSTVPATTPWTFTAIDKWVGEYSPRAKAHVLAQKEKYGWLLDLWSQDSLEASEDYDKPIDVLHIDGDHEYRSVLMDAIAWLPKVRLGGYALFDDYGHDSLPGVLKACTEYMQLHGSEWEFIGQYGNKLGIFKRVG